MGLTFTIFDQVFLWLLENTHGQLNGLIFLCGSSETNYISTHLASIDHPDRGARATGKKKNNPCFASLLLKTETINMIDKLVKPHLCIIS